MAETESEETTELGRALAVMVEQSRPEGRWIDWRGNVWEYIDYVREPYWREVGYPFEMKWPYEMTMHVLNEFDASGARRLPIAYLYGVEETFHPSGTVFPPREWELSRMKAGLTYAWIDKSTDGFWMCRKRVGALEEDGYERIELITNDTPI